MRTDTWCSYDSWDAAARGGRAAVKVVSHCFGIDRITLGCYPKPGTGKVRRVRRVDSVRRICVNISGSRHSQKEKIMSETAQHEEDCPHGRPHHGEHPEPCDVFLTFNGVDKVFHFHRNELVRKLLDEALKAFHVAQNPHLYGLFNAAGTELSDNQTLHEAGVKCGDSLLLRPSSVRAGC